MNLPNYDSWLCAPYERAAEESERYYQFCEDRDVDPDSVDAESLYQDYLDSVLDDYDGLDEPYDEEYND